MSGAPVRRLVCHSEDAAATLVGILCGRGYIGAESEGRTLLFSWGGPIDTVFEVGGWARECGLAGDVEVSEFYMQGSTCRRPAR